MVPPLALVVEDDETQRESLMEFLREEAFDVVGCVSAEAAELVIGGVGADLALLVTDHRLAGLGTGVELAHFAKVRFPSLSVVLVSGDYPGSVPADVRFLRKPFALGEVLGKAHP